MKPIIFERSVDLPVPVEEAWTWHTRPGAFIRMLPPWEKGEMLSNDGSLRNGAKVKHRVRVFGPFKSTWLAEHFGYLERIQFCDRQVQGPFTSFEHCHRFEPLDAKTSRLTDHIEFRPPLGPLGALGLGMIQRRLERAFRYRHQLLVHDLQRHAECRDRPRLKIAISGSTGLVGSTLIPFLTTGGHQVIRLVRHLRKSDLNDGTIAVVWDPAQGKLDPQSLEGVDAIIHLAGESIATGRWTAEKKEHILDSRVKSTALLANTLAKLQKKPRLFFSASAIGFYPTDQGDHEFVEGDEPGTSFLADVCQVWENATKPAEDQGIRTIHGRFGMVLSSKGGALAAQLPIFRFGLAGRIGSGRQIISWIDINDLVAAIHYCLMHDEMRGPVNFTAPEPITNRDYTKTVGKVLHRPTLLPALAFALRLALGEMADALLLASQRVLPQKLLQSGFQFHFGNLESALRQQLGR